MSDPSPTSVLDTRRDQMFPTLTPSQMARIAAHGRERRIERGDILVNAGDPVVPFFVVTAGQLEVIRPGASIETMVAVHGPGQFTGEVNMLLDRRALMQTRVSESGTVIDLTRERLLGLIQTTPRSVRS